MSGQAPYRHRATRHGLTPDAPPDAFAAAMVACQCYAPACSDAGDCAMDGECFESSHFGYAARQIESLAEAETSRSVRAGLKRAAALLRQEIEAAPAEDALQ